MTDDRPRMAWHEVGHGLASLLMTGRPPDLVSIRPGQAFRAITFGTGGDRWEGQFDPDQLSLLQPTELRRAIEHRIVISLSGDAATDLAVPAESGYQSITRDRQYAEAAGRALNRLTPRHRELLAVAETRSTPLESDEEAAAGFSFALTGGVDESLVHVLWLRQVTRRLLLDHLDSMSRLVSRLLKDEVLDGETFAQIAREGRCGCHLWSPQPPASERSA